MKSKRSKNKKMIVAAVLVLVVGGGAAFWWMHSRKPSDAYRRVKVEKGDLNIRILSTGVIQPENRLEIKPPVAGRIEKVLVKEGHMVKKGQLLAWMSSAERAALLDASRLRGPDEYNKWQSYYKATPVFAPIKGMIILQQVEPGQTFTTADAILVMSNRLTVKAQVDETDIAKVKLGQKAEIILDAYQDTKISAVVDQIAYDSKTVNSVTTYIVDVLPKDAPDFMRSGMTANVNFEVSSRADVALLPNEAIKSKNGNYYVFTEGSGSTPDEKAIEIGDRDKRNTEILSGLTENDVVLIPKVSVGAKSEGRGRGGSPFTPQVGGRGR